MGSGTEKNKFNVMRIYQAMERKKMTKKIKIENAKGRLGVLIPGMGAVTTTFLAGLESYGAAFIRPTVL